MKYLKLTLPAVIFGLYFYDSIPENAIAVSPFVNEKYLDKWYEIACLDFIAGTNDTSSN